MKTGRIALATLALVACSDPAPPPADAFCPSCGVGTPPQIPSGISMIVVDNRTDHSISLTIRAPSPTTIDRKVLDGSLSVPIGPAQIASDTDTRFAIAPHETTTFRTTIQIVNAENVETTTGAVFRVGDGPLTFAVGRGFLAVRNTGDGDFVEADDPKSVVILPVEQDTPACTAQAFAPAPLDEVAPLFVAESTPVVSITRDDVGCRVFHFDASAKVTEYRVCVPDAAFPFADGDSLTIEPTMLDGARITNTTGTSLELLDVRFDARRTVRASEIDFLFTEEPSCADVAAVCGDVGVPAKARLSFDGVTTQSLVVGGPPAIDPNDAGRSVLLAGAVAHPVFASSCDERGGTLDRARLVVAIVEKP